MTMLRLSKHAARRRQQRGIPPLIIEWLQRYGASVHSFGDCIRFFNKRSRRALATAVGEAVVQRLAPYLNSYAVVGQDGTVLTVGHRFRRVRVP